MTNQDVDYKNFEAREIVRIRKSVLDQIQEVINFEVITGTKEKKYTSKSHFIRCAINKLLQEEKTR